MKRTAFALVTLGIALAACSKPATADNSSNAALSADENLSDNGAATNVIETENGSNVSL